MLKVIHIQFSTESAGGVVPKLNNTFLENNVDSRILTLNQGINDNEQIIHLGRFPKAISWIESRLHHFFSRNNQKQLGLFSYTILGSNVSGIKEVRNADIIYLHWTQGGFLNIRNIEQLAKLRKPIIFFMHDMWAITGGCHYSFSCEKYKINCGDCPVLPGHRKHDWSAKRFSRKSKLYSKYNNLFFMAPSNWLFECIKQSMLTKNKPSFYIPNIVDTNIFKPIEKNIAKQILNISIDKTIIAFGAVSIKSPYKGWTYFKKALDILKTDLEIEKIIVLVFGGDFNKQEADQIPFDTKYMGFLRDEYSTALVYNAADVFIAPSLADNLPTTVMQSLSCTTPVVGFDTGGIPDMIKHKQNGYISKYKDSEDLANGIRVCLENKIKGYLPPNFDKDIIIKTHIDLINRILS
jgi:glycosyltransferase involved in cell wall biosynthesis